MTVFVLLGAAHSQILEQEIDAGKHPRVEYLELVRHYGAKLSDFHVAQDWWLASWLSRRRLLGPYWASAAHSVRHHRSGDRLIITGEDIGLRTVLLHAIFRRQRKQPHFALITHGSYLGSARFRVVAWLLRRMDNVAFLCLSTAIADGLTSWGIRREQIAVVGYGVDTEFFRPRRTSAPTQRNLVVSAGTANRDYDTLVRAASSIDVELRIAADSAWFCEALNIDPDALADHIEIRSYGNYESLRELYASARAVVVPLREAKRASGYAVILEAMAMEKPVITTAVTGRSDFVDDRKTGFLVPPGDGESLARVINKILHIEEGADAITSAATERVVRENTLERYVERIAQAAGVTAT